MTTPDSQPDKPNSERRPFQYSLRSLLLVVTAVALLLGLGRVTYSFLAQVGVRVHQKGVTTELAGWAVDESQIHNDSQAFRAIDMLRYIEKYYVPGDGYHSDPATEAALQAQRKRTMAAIIEALERFTGERHGDDLQQWEAWRQKRQSQPNVPSAPPSNSP